MFANVLPQQFGGWDNTFRFMGFDVNVLLTYQLGFSVYYGTNVGIHDQRFWNNAADMLIAWHKPGDLTNIPKRLYIDNVSNGLALHMSYSVFNGEYVIVKIV